MIARQFNARGIAAFQEFLAQCRSHPGTPVPHQLLEDDALAERLPVPVTVEPRHFAHRGEASDYLTSRLADLPADDVAQNAGLWTWLSLFYFEEVCPLRQSTRTVRNDYSYIFRPNISREYYRHLLFIGWHAFRIAKPYHRLYMAGSISSLDQVTGRTISRLYLTRIPCMFEVLDRLYWDENRGKARAGIVDNRVVKPGDLRHRLPIRIRQLERTYDLYSLNADQLIELLGSEFQRAPELSRR